MRRLRFNNTTLKKAISLNNIGNAVPQKDENTKPQY